MNHFDKLKQEIRNHLLLILVSSNVVLVLGTFGLARYSPLPFIFIVLIILLVSVGDAYLMARFTTNQSTEPLYNVWQAIMHVAPGTTSDTPAPNLETIQHGRELVTALITQVYKLASKEDPEELAEHRKTIVQATSVVSHLPLPLFVFNKEQVVVNASDAALEYCKLESSALLGKPLYDSVNLEFSNENTLEKWVLDCQQNKVTDTAYWHRVHVRQADQELRQCDIAAYYNRDNPSGAEFIVTLFDHTNQYDRDDQDISFVALAVHELRTPLTMLRGYIEVFEEELDGKLDPELNGFMQKMIVSAQQLGAFFNNILNVARVEQNQLTLKLSECKWDEILGPACEELNLKAKVHNRTIVVNEAPNLPTVAVDRFSIIEVINNLIDNAIKYSFEGETITVTSRLNKEGLVETLVQDHGIGIPNSLIPHLFDKFYRSHRSSGSVGGTGLGLYISKAIVNAHGGEIFVQSTEGKGSTFGFTLLPASKLAEEIKAGDNSGIVRNAHGWIKNHSLYRR